MMTRIRLWLARLLCPKTHHIQQHRGKRFPRTPVRLTDAQVALLRDLPRTIPEWSEIPRVVSGSTGEVSSGTITYAAAPSTPTLP
jgi:DNA-binding transcriptional LysR family regulator